MRLINADKLKEEVKKIAEEEKKENAMWACGLRYALKIIDKAQTVEPDMEFAKSEWICPNCDLYDQAEDNYCQYAGECTIGCRKCKYFKQKGGQEE